MRLMSAVLKLVPETEKLSQKPPLGEKRSKLQLVWENPKISAGTQKGKSEVKPNSSYGRVLYNYFRDYNPTTGRYIESDPIGIEGGLNTYAYVENNPVNAIDLFGLATYSIGLGGSLQQTAAGASASGSIGFDSSGQVCMQFTTCGRIGPGESAGATVNFTVGEGNFCDGNSASGGVFAEGGAGLFGGGSTDYGTSGASATSGFNIGVGGGAAVGSQACIIRTWCF
jgi:RHS repeat-associated protein